MDGVLAKVWNRSSNKARNPDPNSEFHQCLFDSKIGTIKTVLPLTESKRCPKVTCTKVIKSLK